MADLRILQFQEQELKLNNELQDYRDKPIEIGVAPTILYTGTDDTFAVRLQIVYKIASETDNVLEYAILMVFKAEGWNDRIKSLTSDNIAEDADVQRGIDIAVCGARGALAVRTVNTKMAGAILPDFKIEDVLANVSAKLIKQK